MPRRRMGQGSRSEGEVHRGTEAGRGPPRTRELDRWPGPGRRTRAARWRTWASPAHDRDMSRTFGFLLQALIVAVLRWMTGRLRARGACCQAGSGCHGKSSHLSFVREPHHGCARACGEIGKEGYWNCGTGSSKAASDPSELVTSTGPERSSAWSPPRISFGCRPGQTPCRAELPTGENSRWHGGEA